MTASAPYRRVRERLVALASTFDDATASTIVPACPEWTVTDVFAHLSGSCADILEGRLDGVTTDPWTAAQVEARRGLPLSAILGEWTANAPVFDELVDSLGEAMDPRLFLDAWNHEQDIRGAVGVPGGADDPVIDDLAAASVRGWCIRVSKAGLAPFAVTVGGHSNQSGDDPGIGVTTDLYEFHRAQVGRRSISQILAWDWSGDGDHRAYAEQCSVFGRPSVDITDAR